MMKCNQKLSVLFWLAKAKQNAKGLSPIYSRITVDGSRAECSTGQRVPGKYWNDSIGQVDNKCQNATVINDFLEMMQNDIKRHFNLLVSTRDKVTAMDVKRSYQGIKKKQEVKNTFLGLFTKFLIQLKDRVRIRDLSDGRYKRFEVLYRKCERFVKDYYNTKDIYVKDIKLKFIKDFHHYLLTVDGIGLNTASKYAKNLKQVMEFIVVEEDLERNVFKTFKCRSAKSKPKFLTNEELERIIKKNLDVVRLEEVRDCFVFCCYTGFSYSDAAALSAKDVAKGIDGNFWIIRERLKTSQAENVPLLPIPLKLIQKYKSHPHCIRKGKLMPFKSIQKYNVYLKELAQVCKIEKDLTTHVARHTCATTILIANDVPIETAQEFLGHSDIRTTKIYAKIVQKKLSNDINRLKKKLANVGSLD